MLQTYTTVSIEAPSIKSWEWSQIDKVYKTNCVFYIKIDQIQVAVVSIQSPIETMQNIGSVPYEGCEM